MTTSGLCWQYEFIGQKDKYHKDKHRSSKREENPEKTKYLYVWASSSECRAKS
jgi:hypothetical protein